MYHAQLTIDPAHHSPYDIHRLVMSLFKDGECSRVQYAHIDSKIIVRSIVEPITNNVQWCKPLVALFNPAVTPAAVPFILIANPTRRDFKSRKRIPLLNSDAMQSWLTRKAAASGFEVINATVVTLPVWRHDKTIIHRAMFSGNLNITNFDIFNETLSNGIGSAKGFGCGMLIV